MKTPFASNFKVQTYDVSEDFVEKGYIPFQYVPNLDTLLVKLNDGNGVLSNEYTVVKVTETNLFLYPNTELNQYVLTWGIPFYPNNISSINKTTIRNDKTFVWSSYLAVNINGSTECNTYIPLFIADTSQSYYDRNTIFYGNTLNTNNKIEKGFLSLEINGSIFYINIFGGDSNITGCSNIVGDIITDGSFTLFGFALINVNDLVKRFIEIYTIS